MLGVSRRTIAIGALCSTGAAFLVFPSGLMLQRSLTVLQGGGSVSRAIVFAVGSTLIQIAASMLGFLFRIHLSGGSLVRGTAGLRSRLLGRSLSRDSVTSRDEGSAGAFESFMGDTERIEAIVEQVLGGLIPGALLGLSGLAFCLWRDPLFGLVTLVCMLPLLIISPAASRRLSSASWEHRVRQRRVGARVLALLRVREQLADHGAGPLVVRRETSEINLLASASARSLRALAVHTQVQFVGLALAAGVALCTGIWRVETGALSNGELLACLFALVPAQTGGRMVSQSLAQVLTLPMFVEHITRMLGDEFAIVERATARRVDGHTEFSTITQISLDSVSAGFGEHLLFERISLSLFPGNRLYVTGPNAIGKSTLLRILGGRIAPVSGLVIVNGNVVHAGAGSLGRQVAIVPQEAGAVEGTVRENLLLFGSTAPDAELEKALAVVDCSLDLDREVGPDGAALSGGQRQRLVLARAVLHRPSLLLLDEPSTHLDWPLAELLDRLHDAVPCAAMVVVTHETDALPDGAMVLDLRNHVPRPPATKRQ